MPSPTGSRGRIRFGYFGVHPALRSPKNTRLAAVALLALAGLQGCGETTPAPVPPDLKSIDRLLPEIRQELATESAKVNASPRDGSLWGELGLRYEQHKLHVQALECYTVAAGQLPDNAMWPYRAAFVCGSLSDPQAALEWIDRSLGIDSSYITSSYRKGRWLLDLGRLEEARAAFQLVTNVAPTRSEGWAGASLVALQSDQVELALELIQKARLLDPEDPYLHQILGTALMQSGQASEAQSHLAKGRGSSTKVVDPWSQQAQQEVDGNRTLLELGKSLEARGDYEGAVRAYQEIVDNLPGQIRMPLTLARTLVLAGRPEEALQVTRDTLQLYPSQFDLRILEASILIEAGDSEGAWDSYARALAVAPDRPETHLLHSTLLSGELRHEESVRAAERAVELAPLSSTARETLARRYTTQQRPDKAVQTLQEGLEEQGLEPTVRYFKILMICLNTIDRKGEIHAVLEQARLLHGEQAFPRKR
ncbi:MAG: tetratricopeptide (TPR) repeat protein [Planctomycetota bacterium]